EGYEFQVGKPEVIIKEIDGQKMEPMEDVMLDVPDEYQGAVTQELGQRRGEMTHMESDGTGNTRFEYKIPSKALLGIRSILLTKTKGTAVLNTIFDKYAPLTPPVEQIRNGVLIASESGTATTYGLNNAQERGITFIEPATKVYEGMIIGLNSRREDMELNIVKEKKQTNMRASSADIAVVPTPPLKMSLEQYLDFLEEDELLEVTPLNLRPRKKLLSKTDRIRNKR
ncbi:MAG TPA: translational GTPase TypA, partial [Candidatus Saccharimonadales bacterium]|nr:translational GTPase TypA [Candidatus Saccharimonadales bacterium]